MRFLPALVLILVTQIASADEIVTGCVLIKSGSQGASESDRLIIVPPEHKATVRLGTDQGVTFFASFLEVPSANDPNRPPEQTIVLSRSDSEESVEFEPNVNMAWRPRVGSGYAQIWCMPTEE